MFVCLLIVGWPKGGALKVEVQMELLLTEDQACEIPWSQHCPLDRTHAPIQLLDSTPLRLLQPPYYVVIDVVWNFLVLYLGQNLPISAILT